MHHKAMARYIRELLVREHDCWTGTAIVTGEPLEAAIGRVEPDLVIVDAADFPACCRRTLASVRPDQVLVIGPEPDASYAAAAFARGAGGWVAREDVGDGLGPALRMVLGCTHDPCPGPRPADTSASR